MRWRTYKVGEREDAKVLFAGLFAQSLHLTYKGILERESSGLSRDAIDNTIIALILCIVRRLVSISGPLERMSSEYSKLARDGYVHVPDLPNALVMTKTHSCPILAESKQLANIMVSEWRDWSSFEVWESDQLLGRVFVNEIFKSAERIGESLLNTDNLVFHKKLILPGLESLQVFHKRHGRVLNMSWAGYGDVRSRLLSTEIGPWIDELARAARGLEEATHLVQQWSTEVERLMSDSEKERLDRIRKGL